MDTAATADPLTALACGLALFDLPPNSKRPTPGWQQRCTTDPELVSHWIHTSRNLGVGCRASGVVGLDLDRHDGDPDGVAAFTALCDRHGQPWPGTLTVRTPRNGLHLYFRVPTGRIIVSTSGGRSALGPGIDIRGPGRRSGGYLVGPGSLVDGQRYVIVHDTAIQHLPGWLAALLDNPR
ncbi:hypothetical protein GCM10012275_54880 [Longimycelium tulufanense]|uniref:DNA primase/polymerase bifunctional N-terminal domain-containing protein n=1 Tax=Longimycelium tulufanense TaxID=907463 RepID=A0A8J3FZ43_9PSEU|nr:bifunctional DNA primase/polymerase [Longimycelium tulufanense]GGM77259.1 hypothetical protein GCM10012275_54880 [Longimycelium tulufanense]